MGSSTTGEIGDERVAIGRAIDSGLAANEAIMSVIRARHAKEQEQLAREQQVQKENLKIVEFDKAEKERHELRQQMIAEYEGKLANSGDNYEQVEIEFKTALKQFDNETINVAERYQRDALSVLALKHETARMELLDRQLN